MSVSRNADRMATQKSTSCHTLTYLHYGIREGELLHISQVSSSLSCGCVCLACHAPLVAKKGRQREHHFAHGSGDSCQHAIETALHLAAKDVLARRREIALPAVEIKFPYDKFVDYDFSHKTVTIAPEQLYQLDSVELEHRISEIIPDVLAKVKNRSLLIEIRVTHKVDERKPQGTWRKGKTRDQEEKIG
ncbi:MAG: hypothetical protein F4218_00615, partial [Synechococcus sp. SB0677_bin_5]|nr:hypothetical protein [Synechococcus sp. SB0677_bin_5]